MPSPVVPITQLRQWCVAKLTHDYMDGSINQDSKRPLSPNGYPARVDDPRTWCSYAEAVEAIRVNTGNALGIVLTQADDLCVFDLDNKTMDPAVEAWNWHVANLSWRLGHYVERSASGLGYHVVFRGPALPSHRRRDVEFYSSGRFVILTFNGPVCEPRADHTGMLAALHHQLFGDAAQQAAVGVLEELPETEPDVQVLTRLFSAVNGADSQRLYYHPVAGDQSQLDARLIERLCFATRSNEQVRRLFMASVRGQREKVRRRYPELVNRAIQFARGRQAPPRDVVIRLRPPTPPGH